MARKRTGTLVYTKKDGWCVRVWRDVEGERIREWEKLDTHDRRVAKIRQQRLAAKLASGAAPIARRR